MDFLTQLFSNLPVRDSWLVLLFLLGAFLIGFITAWIYWRSKWKSVKGELDLRTNELNSLRTKYDELTAALELKEADLKKATLEIEELTARIRQLEEEKGHLHADVFAARQDLEKLNTEKEEFLAKEQNQLTRIEDLDNQILGLKTKNQAFSMQADQDSNALNELAQLQSKFNATTAKLNQLEKEKLELDMQLKDSLSLSQSYVDYDDLKARLGTVTEENEALKLKLSQSNTANSDLNDLRSKFDALNTENEELRNKLNASITSSNQSNENYEALKSKIGDLSEENADLKKRLAGMLSELEEAKNKAALAVAAPEEESKEEKAAKGQAAIKAALGSKIKAATAEDKDDLKLINGIGPFIEQKLNGLGIYTFEQISQFDEELIEQVTDGIQFFPGRIKRDDWVGQAKILMGKKNSGTLLAATTVKLPNNIKQDDLKVIEGIGPKIEGLLKADGITTWVELANADVSRIQEILTAAGSRYTMHNPASWPLQSKMCAEGKWDELKVWQDEHDGGRL